MCLLLVEMTKMFAFPRLHKVVRLVIVPCKPKFVQDKTRFLHINVDSFSVWNVT